jgi:hypothetical protein
VRIEYDERNGRRVIEDVEVMTPHYRGRMPPQRGVPASAHTARPEHVSAARAVAVAGVAAGALSISVPLRGSCIGDTDPGTGFRVRCPADGA